MSAFRRRILSQGIYKIDKDYDKSEGNEIFKSLEVVAYEDLNNDSLPDHLIISETCGGNHEKLSFEISNLIVNQKYILTFDEWSNATVNGSLQPTWLYGCVISPTNELTSTPGKTIFEGLPMWDCTDSIGGSHQGFIEFTATANTMYWIWDFGALTDSKGFNHKINNINLELVVPTFNLVNAVTKQGTGTYEKVSAVNNDYVTFNFTGASGVEVIYYNITDLTKNGKYRFTFSEAYHGTFNTDTYQYGCTISSELSLTSTGKPVTCLVIFNEENTEGTREATFSFTPTTAAGYWIWDFGRWSDSKKNENTFKIIKLEIQAPDGTYKTLIG